MNAYKKLANILKKSGGEGTKGGHVIGHTRSGKPIYSSSSHEGHQKFGSAEHRDAMNQHHEIWSKTQQKISSIRSKNPTFNPPKKVNDFLQHHYTQMQMHQNRASTKEAQEKRTKAALTPKPTEIRGPKPIHTMGNIHKSHEDRIPSHSATVIINPEKTKFLMGKRWRDDIWTPPAGGAHLGEFPMDTAIRECFEESNILLEESQLIELPMLYTNKLKPVYCFMAILNKDQMKKITEVNDPDEEIKKWKWFDLEGVMPEPIDEKRFNTVLNAKLKLAEMMQKSYITMDDMEGMTAVNPSEVAQETHSFRKDQDLIESHMEGYQSGDEPRMIPLEGSTLYLVRIDDGIYSGFVKRLDRDGLLENVANIDKMTIPSMVQFLVAKQVIKNQEEPKKPSQEDELKRLLNQLIVKERKMVYVSMDGDNIGNRVAQAEARDDEAALMEFSRRINAGQTIFQTWAKSVGGEVIEGGGDEALAKVPEAAKEKIEFFRKQYEEVVGATVTVGVGDSISQATKARELGKLKGKNRTEVFMPGSDDELQRLYKPLDEAQKLRDSKVLELVKSLLAKGGPLPLGTVRKWGVHKYVKHPDGWVAVGGVHDGKLMGNFLDEPTHSDYARHYSRSSPRDSEAGKGSDSKEERAEKSAGLETLVSKLQGTEAFQKSEGAEVGTIRTYQGAKFRKHESGHWLPHREGDSSDEGNLKVHQSEPSSIAQPKQEHEGATSEIPMSMADQSGDSQLNHVKETKGKPIKSEDSVSKQNEEGALSHLEPREGIGGHVPLHSKDLKESLSRGQFSIISCGRNHSDPKDRALTDEQVGKRHKKLEEELKDMGHKYTKVRREGGGKEDGFMVHHAEESKMNELGKKYNQESVLHSKKGKHKLAYTNGEHEGKWHEGNGYQEVPDAKDYFTSVDTSDGQKKKFDLNLNYGKYHSDDGDTV